MIQIQALKERIDPIGVCKVDFGRRLCTATGWLKAPVATLISTALRPHSALNAVVPMTRDAARAGK